MASDGDILTNKEEYDAGTDPQDSSSFLQIDSLVQSGGSGTPVSISFLAASNKTYSIQFNDVAAGGFWSKLIDVAATPTNRVVEVQDTGLPPENASRYYRLVTPRQP